MDRKKIWWTLLHGFIIFIFCIEILYCMYEFIFVWNVGGSLILFNIDVPFEVMVTRRLYAIEMFISIVGLALYLAIVYRKKFFSEKPTNQE